MSLPRDFSRFLLVGGSATALMYGLLILQVECLGADAVPSSGIAYGASSVFNYWANYHWTFASTQRHTRAIWRFVLIALGGLLLNVLLMQILVAVVNWPYLPAQFMTTILVLLWNFFAHRHWTFANAPSH